MDPVVCMQNRERFHAAGVAHNSVDVAGELGISISYAEQLLRGSKPISAPIRAKLDALIAAKANGPVESPYVLEHGEIKERVEQVEVDLPKPSSPTSAVFVGDAANRYQIQEMPIGFFKVVSVAAMTRDRSIAERICDLLNKEGG